MFSNLIVSALLTASIGVKSLPVTVPVTNHLIENSATVETSLNVNGSYNFRDIIDWDTDDLEDGTYVYTFEVHGDTDLFLVPIHRTNETAVIYYLYDIEITVDRDDIAITFDCYNHANHYVQWDYDFGRGESLSDVYTQAYGDLIFEVREPVLLHGMSVKAFTAVFTFAENVYTFNYSGYYSFTTGLTNTHNYIAVFGYYIFNQTSYSFMFNYGDGAHTDSTSNLYMSYYQFVDDTGSGWTGYSIESYSLPFNNNTTISNNIYMTGVKMSRTTYLRMQNVGVFSYVRDTSYDNVTFKDFFFSIVDTPIYFLSSLLSFELFGVNLFIALTGLLTICVILVLIKKFW